MKCLQIPHKLLVWVMRYIMPFRWLWVLRTERTAVWLLLCLIPVKLFGEVLQQVQVLVLVIVLVLVLVQSNYQDHQQILLVEHGVLLVLLEIFGLILILVQLELLLQQLIEELQQLLQRLLKVDQKLIMDFNFHQELIRQIWEIK